jgi:PAS domain S-box-containing protein
MEEPYKIITVTDLEPGDHLCCLYESEEEHRALLTPFLRQGLERNQKVLYIVDARTAEDILDYLRDDGVDVQPYIDSGQLGILTIKDAYMKEGVFDPDGMIRLLRQETERALSEGYSALRVTGEMTWALKGLPGSERLMEYEAKLNRFFQGSACLAICQYDRRRFPPDMLLDVLTTHPIAVLGTEIQENFYYIHPDEYLSNELPQSTLDHWIANLKEKKASKNALEHLLEEQHNHEVELEMQNRELREAQQELEESRNRYADLYDFAPVGYVSLDNMGVIQQINLTGSAMIGIERERLIGMPFSRYVQPEDREVFLEHMRRGERSEDTVTTELRLNARGKPSMDVELSSLPSKNRPGSSAVYRTVITDITERKRAEEALSENEEKYRLIVDNAQEGIWTIDSKANTSYANQRMADMLGYSVEEMLGRSLFDFMDEEARKAAEYNLERRRKGIREQHDFEFIRKDGLRIYTSLETSPVLDEEGNFIAAIALVADITERKLAEDELLETRNYLDKLIRYANAPIIVWDPYGQITRFNRAFEVLTGYASEEVMGRDLDILFPQSSRVDSLDKITRALAGEYLESVEIPILRKDGEVRIALWNSANIYDADGSNLLATIAQGNDITRRKRAEEELEEYKEHLEELVEERTLNLERINLQLQQEISRRKNKEDQLRITANQLRALAAHLESVREEEKRRIALEVHDSLGQALTGLKINLTLLRKRMAGDKALDESIEAMSDLVDNTIQSVRDISTDLRPGIIDDLGLIATLEWQLKKFEEMTGIECSLVSSMEDGHLDKDLSIALFRISQEALTNIARHAEANRVNIVLAEEDGSLVMKVSDDGRGVTEGEISSATSVGILGMRERTFAFGGDMDIRGEKGRGTMLTIRIPFGRHEAS